MRNTQLLGLLMLSMILTTPLIAQEVKEQLTVPLSDPAKPYKLDVNLVNGSIKVVGYAGKEIVIDAVANSKQSKKDDGDGVNVNVDVRPKKDNPNTAGMKRISSGNGLELSAEENNNKVRVHSDSWKRSVNLSIKVPMDGTLKLGTVNNGDIIVENVNGEIEITNVNGDIQLSGIAGSGVANTVNGNVIVTFKSIDPKAAMAFSTLNGNVDVTFPALAKANVKLKSDRGEIYSDFDIDVDKTQPKAVRTNQGGMYKVNIEDWVYGKINGGGPEMLMKNMNGNIYIRKVK